MKPQERSAAKVGLETSPKVTTPYEVHVPVTPIQEKVSLNAPDPVPHPAPDPVPDPVPMKSTRTRIIKPATRLKYFV